MLPITLAPDVRRQVLHYLGATFNFREKAVEQALLRFLEDPEEGIFKGPWLQLRRPFRPAGEGEQVPFVVQPPFHPFKHQSRSWRRLFAGGERPPESTLVTTGTGSGKTECFLFPILDACLRDRKAGKKGIKAIVLYPMNALANDQAGRFARQVLQTPAYREAGIRVGLYTGYDDNGADKNKRSTMGYVDASEKQAYAIDDHEALKANPPDILLTNYKMLDYLLLRPSDQDLWQHNGPGALRYLVLDELHTYDGAQGSDVACLIRRLKERLDIPRGGFCVVGTSATIAGEDGLDRLRIFAGDLFEEDFPPECVIGEDRLNVEEIVSYETAEDTPLPPVAECVPLDGETADDYAIRQAAAWRAPVLPANADTTTALQWTLDLGQWLKRQSLFRRLLDTASTQLVTWSELLEKIGKEDFRLGDLTLAERHHAVASFCGMIAHARELRSGKDFPLLPTQVQLWVRELRRLGRVVSPSPAFAWLDEAVADKVVLPAFHCAACGASGWVAMHDRDKDSQIGAQGVTGYALATEPKAIYAGWFGGSGRNRDARIRIIIPQTSRSASSPDGQQLLDTEQQYLSTGPGVLTVRRGQGPCPITGAETFPVQISDHVLRRERDNAVIGDQKCPCCQTADQIFFIGSQGATIASVAIDEIFGSLLNSDPKMLAFTDSVQDASHRAGFFTARTYHFTFRTALQHLVDSAGPEGLPLPDVGRLLMAYASEAQPGRPGSLREAMATLVPPDIREHREYEAFVRSRKIDRPATPFLEAVHQRMSWEAARELGMQVQVGRTLERSGSCCLRWDPKAIAETVRLLQSRLPQVDPTLMKLTGDLLRLWIYGMLQRHRERGALSHEYVALYAKTKLWGKYGWKGEAPPARETHPHAGRRRPRLFVTDSDRNHDHVLAPGATWQLRWSRRVFDLPATSDVALLDLTRAFIEAGIQAGLLVELERDGTKRLVAINSQCAAIVAGGEKFVCSETGHTLTRPAEEAACWHGAPTISYQADGGTYARAEFDDRERYYQQRYRKGAIRRVYATEHTGLLTNSERQDIERRFGRKESSDDPNVLTCTSTLEMGIDIGDLSTTMLCSIPPNTANYLQRIGRAGRSTGTALIVSIINQRPHDLYFFARPDQMLKGEVEPPGCWLDAAAVLARQYFAYCFDCAVKTHVLAHLPGTARQFGDDLFSTTGQIPKFFDWMSLNEASLRAAFMQRFHTNVQSDTRERFLEDSKVEVLREQTEIALRQFETKRKDLINAGRRLKEQRNLLHNEDDRPAIREIDREIKILKGRLDGLNRTTSLELLTDYGLLPNYAFPERGVSFYGAVYNKHQAAHGEDHLIEYDIVRGAGTAIRELAPKNHFYTHSRVFEIQQIELGTSSEPLTEPWAVCGSCGHMRRTETLTPDADSACPQCAHAEGEGAQTDIGQQKKFVNFARSQALSYVEAYESLSGDKAEERENRIYRLVNSFDLTTPSDVVAVADETEPFGMEYRSSLVMRQVNGGFWEEAPDMPFGFEKKLPNGGFKICADCGVVSAPFENPDDVSHRRSCRGRRETEKRQQQGTQGAAYRWEHVFLYRELKSEAVRLLLPPCEPADLTTLSACIHLGMRLMFQGNPAHLLVLPETMPDQARGVNKDYLLLMDAVPGGTGFLKTLFQKRNAEGLPGEGLIQILRLALNSLETCRCRRLGDSNDTDGCYRCIRNYQQQSRAADISRDKGINLLKRLIAAGEHRKSKTTLDQINVQSLFGSMLEKKFVECLRQWVAEDGGKWDETIIRGSRGFRFRLGKNDERYWDVQLQPDLGPREGVSIQCQPDFLISCDDDGVKPLAVFTDGFDPHVHPTKPESRLPDDLQKRRAILKSGNFHVWSITWEDLMENQDASFTVKEPVRKLMADHVARSRAQARLLPDARLATGNGFVQLQAFIRHPLADGWQSLVERALFMVALGNGLSFVADQDKDAAVRIWGVTGGWAAPQASANGCWAVNNQFSQNSDFILALHQADLMEQRAGAVLVLGRLGDSAAERSGTDYRERWRRFLASMNLFQFVRQFDFFAATEHPEEDSWSMPGRTAGISAEWEQILQLVVGSLIAQLRKMAERDCPVPEVEFYHEELADDACAEVAWSEQKIAVLVGDQASFASQWQGLGWKVVTSDDLAAKGTEWFAMLLGS
ncbi:DEAD/DEAH box helicase [Prosthecobacter sp.]|uniref:DEAD/DEAH box helicase n=1 Tax=Prosthecobacter sp. TaxID=1965333 RepID=UPI0037849E5F